MYGMRKNAHGFLSTQNKKSLPVCPVVFCETTLSSLSSSCTSFFCLRAFVYSLFTGTTLFPDLCGSLEHLHCRPLHLFCPHPGMLSTQILTWFVSSLYSGLPPQMSSSKRKCSCLKYPCLPKPSFLRPIPLTCCFCYST